MPTDRAEESWHRALTERTRGHSEIRVALLDGPVDLGHPCFAGADIEAFPTLVTESAIAGGAMAGHGTHVASLLFGQPGSPVEGLAPRCHGMLFPIFSDERRHLSQMDLARAIQQAVEAGAQVINVSGGQKSEGGHAEDFLVKATQFAAENNVLIVAAAGNDGCACLHVPAALPAVLVVGAMDDDGRPLVISNWGEAYQKQGILAPGAHIRGAKPGGGTFVATGTSFAAPLVTGIVALLLSLQIEQGEKPDPRAVRDALLRSALPCEAGAAQDEQQCLAGRLHVSGAIRMLKKGEPMSDHPVSESNTVEPSGCGCGAQPALDPRDDDQAEAVGPAAAAAPPPPRAQPSARRPGVRASQAEASGGMVYTLGVLGYDFAGEARRDTFKQLMPPATIGGVTVPANPYDARQMVDYLKSDLSEAQSLIWTLNLELTPIYAIQPVGPFAREVYQALQKLLEGQVQAESSKAWIERVSIPGRLSERTVRLFSGQVVPVITVDATRGIYGWNVNALQDAAIQAVKKDLPQGKEQVARKALTSFLYQVYYKLRNLGQTSRDRALNFAATNAFQVASVFSEAVGAGMELDDIEVVRSPFCRMDSDCWDVTLGFFDAENLMRARKRFQFTIDVSDVIPVTLGEVRSWSSR